jgi:hypothetical protein
MSPTITTTLGALVQAEAALQTLCALKLSAKAAYHLMKLAKAVTPETKHYHEARDGHLKELGTLTEDRTHYTFTAETGPDFSRRLEELADVPVTIAWGPVTMDMLGDHQIAAADLIALGPLWADPIDPAPEAAG